MQRNLIWLIALSSLFVLSGCGKKSRFDESTVVNVCSIVGQAEAEGILGPLSEPPTEQQASGIAGDCTWSFKSASAGNSATLYAMLMTRGSNGKFQDLDRWFAQSLEEARVSLGAEPAKVKDLGDRAFLFQTPQPDHSEIWMQQGKTYLVLRIMGASASQLESFARVLSRNLQPQK